MQVYFVKATYTNNVYKIGDFFTSGSFKLVAGKMLDINFKPDDGLTSFITKNITLPDTTSVRDHTHIIIPDFTKIYHIASIDYMNNDQYMLMLDEDPLIGNYQELLNTYLILQRTNDPSLWRGVNDIADMTLKETVEASVITSANKTGKWALLFFQYNPDDDVIGLKFKNSLFDFEHFADLTAITTKYPEVNTTQPELYDYFQKTAYVDSTHKYQCVYDGSGTNARLRWVAYIDNAYETYYVKIRGTKINEGEVMTSVIALPFEKDFIVTGSGVVDEVLSYDHFIGPTTTNLIDIKIVNDLLLEIDSVTYSLTDRAMIKTLNLHVGSTWWEYCYQDDGRTTISDKVSLSVTKFVTDINITPSYSSTPMDEPKSGEPFYKYDLYVFGKKFTIPYFLIDSIRLMISINSGVINFLIYTVDKRNVLGSGSFTHSIKYAIDQLDAFYSQNPTYKDQFFTQMGTNAIKNVAGGAIAGSVIPGIGTAVGALVGLASAGVDAGLSYLNFKFQEKSLRLKPDQVFGETSEVSLQIINIFGIYWVKRTSSNIDLMLTEYELRGFPTSVIKRISDLVYQYGTLFALGKVVYGELKNVVKNEYTTQFINQKLKEGLVFVP
jgi:hypothetical protein